MTYGYRCEDFFGEGYRDAASVLGHETFVLDNTDILDSLINSKLISRSMKSYLLEYATLMKEGHPLRAGGYDTDYEEMLYRYRKNEEDRKEFFGEVLDDIYETTGFRVKYCLGLCDTPMDCFDSYSINKDIKLEDLQFDEYEKSDIILADNGREGKLYGYEKEPKRGLSLKCQPVLQNFYFTFSGADMSFPYQNGYLIVRAENEKEAFRKFRAKYADVHPNCLNCAFWYTQEKWDAVDVDMGICHEVIE